MKFRTERQWGSRQPVYYAPNFDELIHKTRHGRRDAAPPLLEAILFFLMRNKFNPNIKLNF